MSDPLKLGKFQGTRQLFVDNWRSILPIAGEFVIIGIEWDAFGAGTFTALSELFDEIKEGDVVPAYDIIVTETDGQITVEARRKP